MKFLNLILINISLLHFIYGSTIKSLSGNIFFDPNSNGNEHVFQETRVGIGNISPTNLLHISGNAYSDQANIGTTNGKSTLQVSGTIGINPITITTNTNIPNNTMVFADTSSGNILSTLPYAGNSIGRVYSIKKINQNHNLTIDGGGNLIDDYIGITFTSPSYGNIDLISNGSSWKILNNYGNIYPSSNLIGWWELDENTGITANDSSIYSNNGDLQTNFTFSGGNSVSGNVNSGLSFNGSNEMIKIHNSTFSSSTGSILVWARADNTTPSSFKYLVSRNDTTGTVDGDVYIYLSSSDDKMTFAIQSGSGSAFCDADTSLSDTNWHHYAAVWGPSGLRFFIDGIKQADEEAWINVTSHSLDFAIGRQHGSASGGSNLWDGAIDDVRIYNKALSDGEVYQIFCLGKD